MGYLTHGATAGGKTYVLLPCPHCGGEAEFRDGSSTKPYIRCKECGCRTWGSHYVYDEVLCGWACSECGGLEPVGDHVRYCPDCGARIEDEVDE